MQAPRVRGQESVKQDVYNAVKHDMDFANDARYQDVCTQLAELRTQYDNLELNFNREIVSVKKKRRSKKNSVRHREKLDLAHGKK